MIYNYIPGTTEVLTLQSIGQNTGVNTVVKADGSFTNIFSDLVLYTDSGGVTQVPTDSYAMTSIDSVVTGLEEGKTNKTAFKTYIVTNPSYQNVPLWASFTNFGVYTDMGAVADYQNRTKTKVLWTGPLSVVSTPTSMNVGEAFSDWDLIEVDFNGTSDVGLGGTTPYIRTSPPESIRHADEAGSIVFARFSDTSFQITLKTVVAGNIQRIIGIKL